MGGEEFVRAEVQLSVDVANLAYASSGIGSELRLVHVMRTEYEEIDAWEYLDHVNFLYYPDDGRMDDVLVMRDVTGADFASVLIDGRDALGQVETCGMAPVMQPHLVNPDFEPLAISIVSIQCAATDWTLAHEVGHNRGCAHNREDAGLPGAYSYSYGHRFDAGGGHYSTVMAYNDSQGNYTRIPYFSNPDVEYSGVPTGVVPGLVGEAHNALTHDQTAALCAAFRIERTFVEFGWTGTSDGSYVAPFASLAEALSEARDGGGVVLMNSDPAYSGVLQLPRLIMAGDSGSAVLGGN
jgi:hypothetical protein